MTNILPSQTVIKSVMWTLAALALINGVSQLDGVAKIVNGDQGFFS